MGSPDQGTLQVSYSKGGGVSFTCTPTQLYTITVNITGGDGYDTVTSSPAGLDCDSSGTLLGGAPAVCTASFPADYAVTLTETSSPYDSDVLARPDLHSRLVPGARRALGGFLPGGIAPPTQAEGLVPQQLLYNSDSCTIPDLTGNATETLNFDAGMFVRDASQTFQGLISVSPVNPLWEGKNSEFVHPSSSMYQGEFVTIPYGSTVTLTPADSGATATFDGQACGPAATITSTSCTFTLTQAANGQGPIGGQYWNAEINPSS